MRAYLPLQPPAIQRELIHADYRYREFMPSKALAPYVACYWSVDSDATVTNHLHRVIPDGCADIIFDLRAPSPSKGAFVAGVMTAFETRTLTSRYSLFGIRFSNTDTTISHILITSLNAFTDWPRI